MPIIVQRHLCAICRKEHRSFNDAVTCEALPTLNDLGIIEGQSISFEDESTMFGTRYSYSSDSGIVLFKYMLCCTDNESGARYHQPAYIVDCGHCEKMVTVVKGDFGKKLTSLAEWKYRKGYADDVRNEMSNPY